MTDPTETYTDPVAIIRLPRHNLFRNLLIADTLTVAILAGTQAVFTHHQWIRDIDTLVVIAAILDFARLLITRDEH